MDEVQPCLPNARWRWRSVCHLCCEPGAEDELHRVARDIGLKREWFRDRKGLPHYDLTIPKRTLAIAAGATAIDRKFLVELMRRWCEKPEKEEEGQ